MKKTLVLFAHPYFEHSTTNVRLLECYEAMDHVTVRDLYEDYPDFHIQPFRERKRIVEYQRIIFHFPIIWFGLPPLLKLWIDEVFDMRWITETGLNILSGKDALIVTMCRSGSERGKPSADYLLTQGFSNVKYIDHGFQGSAVKEGVMKGFRTINGWQNSKLPWSPKINAIKINKP